MKAQLKQTAIHMLTLALLFVAAYLFAGCSATKIKFEKTSDGTTKYSIWHNDHWLKTEAESLTGGMSQDGQFSLGMTGLKSSPSEEFNRTMQTYTAAVVSMMQIAAAAYNPSASAAARGEGAAGTQSDSGKARASQIILEAPKTESQPELIMLTGSQSSTGNNAAASQTSQQSQTSQSDCPDGSCTTGECTDGSCNPNEVK